MESPKLGIALFVMFVLIVGVKTRTHLPQALGTTRAPSLGAIVPNEDSPRTAAAKKTLALVQARTSSQDFTNQQVRDTFAWNIFAAISGPESTPTPQPGSGPHNNDTVWEAWADNAGTFKHAKVTPVFPIEQPFEKAHSLSNKHLQKDKVLELLQTLSRNSHSFTAAPRLPKVPAHSTVPGVGELEEVRRNEIAFNAIRDQNAWYVVGLKHAIASHPGNPENPDNDVKRNVFEMPSGSIQVKAVWKLLPCDNDAACAADNAKYHVNFNGSQRLGLVALHIMAKVDKQWIWATWEWAGDGKTTSGLDGNLGRCDTGCADAYGVEQRFARTRPRSTLGGAYTPEPLSQDLIHLLAANHLGSEWRNYRLKGTQVDQTPATLGNSQIERPYVFSSSCVTCHSRASVSLQGNATVAFTDDVHPIFTGTAPNTIGPTGPINGDWFRHGHEQVYFRTDSVWSFMRTIE